MEELMTSNKNGEQYEFAFVIKRVDLLRKVFTAFCDKKFNRTRKAVIRVGKEGVRFDTEIGCLVFTANKLEKFECKKPLQKAFSLKGMGTLFKSALKFGEFSVFVFVVEGSNKLSFQWSEFGYGIPFHIDLNDLEHKKQGKSRRPSLRVHLARMIERTWRNGLQQPAVGLLVALE